jgi:hypothetical protein
MNIARKIIIIVAFLAAGGGICFGQSSSPSATSKSSSSSPSTSTASTAAPYTEGSVWEITMVKTKAGMGDDYIKNLAKNYKTVMEEEKKQNLILSYKVLLGDASTAGDYNMLLMVEYKNMAALDGLRDKIDPIAQKTIGNEDQRRDASIKRADIREILGSKTMREITLK